MASLKDVKIAAEKIVGPICDYKARSFTEAEVGRILHAYLEGSYGGVKTQCPVTLKNSTKRIDFRFGDWPYGANPCVLELAVRNTDHGAQLTCSQNKTELAKLSRYPKGTAQTRVLLLLDLGHLAIPQNILQPGYDSLRHLGAGKYQRATVRVLYVHRSITYHFPWKPKSN